MARTLAYRSATRPVLALLVVIALLGPPGRGLAPAPVAAADNPVAAENRLPGTEAWKLAGPGMRVADDVSRQIKGYASATSVNVGGAIGFHVTVSPPQQYTVDIFRVGWYGGAGGRLMAHLGPLAGTTQPTCPTDAATGLIACDWAVGATLAVPASWVSGVYLALLTNDQGYQNYVPFVVRDDARPAALLYQQAVATYQAYNNYPNDGATGKSLYNYNSAGATVPASGTSRAVKVSFDRPYADTGAGDFLSGDFRTWQGARWEIYFVRWLERAGYDVAYSTNLDTHAAGGRLLDHRAFLSVGHDEYWSGAMYDAAEAARDAGVHLAFFGANDVYWQVRFEPSAAGVPDRTMVGYKEAASRDPVQGATTTARFRDAPVDRAEQGLLGVQFTTQNTGGGDSPQPPYVVANSDHWVYAGTGFADGAAVPGIVGYEIDRRIAGAREPTYRPGTYTVLADSPVTDLGGRADRHNAAIYQAPSGAWVFAAGTIAWAWALDRPGFVDARLQRTTANLLDRFIAGEPDPTPSPSPAPSPAANPSPSPSASPSAGPVPSPQACASGFADVPASHPACAAILALTERGVIAGYATTPPTFGPDDGVERAQVAAFLVRALQWQGRPTGPQSFSDFGQLVGELRTAGLILANACDPGGQCVAYGYADGRFGPNDNVSYAQVISFIARAFQLDPAYAWQPQASGPLPYSGVPAVHAPDVRVYHHYAGTIPAAPAGDDWNAPANRAWVALAIYQAALARP